MDLGIAGKWALVCGASQGLGFGCARALAREGVNVVLVARTESTLRQAMDTLHGEWAAGDHAPEVLAVAADVTTPEGREAVREQTARQGIEIDILITNAGGPPPGDFRDWSREDWVRALDANMLSPIELMRQHLDGMAGRGFGRVLNITSSAVKAPIDILGLSNGARSGLTGFVAGVARSPLAARNVTINNVLPGTFDTSRLRATIASSGQRRGQSTEEASAQWLGRIPARRFGSADEFGAFCAFLCSQQAGYVTGQNFLLDGGAYNGVF